MHAVVDALHLAVDRHGHLVSERPDAARLVAAVARCAHGALLYRTRRPRFDTPRNAGRMNVLPPDKRVLILKCLTESMGMRATARIADLSRQTVSKLLADASRVRRPA